MSNAPDLNDKLHGRAKPSPAVGATEFLIDDPTAEPPPSGPVSGIAEREPTPGVIAPHWRTIEDRSIKLNQPPPRRNWLLKLGEDGALPLGKCGVLAAGGGTGKTMLLTQLALAVATGGVWLDTFRVTNPGKVLLALAEEDEEEVYRRLYNAAQQLEMDLPTRELAAKNIVALPLAGIPIALTERDAKGGNVRTTEVLEEMKALLSRDKWSLIVLDPLARWAGDDAETDNASATRLVQAVESLSKVPGTPTVLVAHHSSKDSLDKGEANVRGSSAIVDGFRWAAVLDERNGELDGRKIRGVRLRLCKSNYTKHWGPIYLRRNEEGALRKAIGAEAEAIARGERSPDDKTKKANGQAKPANGKFSKIPPSGGVDADDY